MDRRAKQSGAAVRVALGGATPRRCRVLPAVLLLALLTLLLPACPRPPASTPLPCWPPLFAEASAYLTYRDTTETEVVVEEVSASEGEEAPEDWAAAAAAGGSCNGRNSSCNG